MLIYRPLQSSYLNLSRSRPAATGPAPGRKSTVRIYSRYLLKEMLTIFALSLLALVSIYLLVDFFAKVDNAMENHAGWLPLFLFLLNQVPFILGKFIPLALLLATMLSLGGMAQNNEIVAFQAGGLSLFRLALPLAGAGVVMAFVTFAINNNIVPVTSLKADHLKTVSIRGNKEKNLYNLKSLWYTGRNKIYYFADLDPARRSIGRARLYRFSPDHRLKQRLDLENLTYNPAKHEWTAARAQIREFTFNNGFTNVSGYHQSHNRKIAISERFRDFLVPRIEPDRMTLKKLEKYISKARSTGLPYMKYTVEVYNRLLYPCSCVLMILLAIPFSLSSRRSGGAARGIAVSLGLGFSFWVVLSISLALGQGRLVSPLAAAVAPYLLYGGFALYMLRQKV